MSILEDLIAKFHKDCIIGSITLDPNKHDLRIDYIKHGESDNEIIHLNSMPSNERKQLVDSLVKAWQLIPDRKQLGLWLSSYYQPKRLYEISLKIADKVGVYSHLTTLDLGTKFFIKADFEQSGSGRKQKIDFTFPFKLERNLILAKVKEILAQMA